MFRVIRAIAWLVAILLAFPPAVSARSLAQIEESGKLRLCPAGASADFYEANGVALAGFLGVEAQVVRLADWDAQFENADGQVDKGSTYVARRLADERCDVYPNDLHVLAWRQSKMDLVPYYSTRKVVVARRELRAQLRGVDDLMGRRAVVQKGTAYDTWLQDENTHRFAGNPVAITYQPTDKAMRAVADGAADFTVVGGESAFKWIRGDLERLDILFPVGEAVAVGWGIQPQADDLRARIEAFFDANRRVGSELDRAWHKNYGISLMEYRLFFDSFKTAGYSIETLLRWGIPTALSLLAILSAILFRNARLGYEVRERKQNEERISALLEQQTRFFAFVAHELRNQLGVIVSGLANLRVGLAGTNDAVQQRINRISGATQRLSGLIDRHLRLQRLARADFVLNVEECSPGFPAVLAIDLVAEGQARNAIEYLVADDVPTQISIDTELVSLAIVNLLDNAIKHSPSGSPVTLSVGRDAANSACIVYGVRDLGSGIAPADREHLFDIYVRQPRQGDCGFGIGLALVANIARHHGGSVDCVSSPGRGATFSLRLPIESADPDRARESA